MSTESRIALADFLESLRFRLSRSIREYGWDQPIRPEHVPIPEVPSIGASTALRSIVATTFAFVALSVFATLPIRGHLTRQPFLFVPSVIDGVSELVGPMFGGSMSLDMATRSATTATFPSWGVGYLIGLTVALIPSLAIGIALGRQQKKLPKRYEGATENADFASLNDMRDSGLLAHGKPGVVVGAVQPPPYPAPFHWIKRPLELLIDANPAHVVMDASSRSGKDVGPISFTGATYPYSLCLNDNKSEQYALLSGIQRDYYGKHVFRLAFQAGEVGELVTLPNGKPFEEQWGSTKHNLLNDIPWGTDREFSAVLQSASLIVCKDLKMLDDGENGHWFRTSRVAETILMYKVNYDPLETMRNVSRTAMIMAGDEGLSEEQKAQRTTQATDGAEVDSIHSVIEHYLGWSATGQGSRPAWLRRAVDSQRDSMKQRLALKRMRIGIDLSEADYAREEQRERLETEKRIAKIEAALVHPDLERAVRTTMRIRGEEAGSVYSTLQAQLTPWLDPRVMANTSRSDMKLTDLMNADVPAAMFLCNSQDYGVMFQPIYRVTLDLLIRLHLPDMAFDNERKAVVSPNRWPCIFIFNEPLTMGEIPSLTPNLPFLASYGMRFFFPFQLRSQRRELFGENEQITGNSWTHISHVPNDGQDREALSNEMGKRPVVVEDQSASGLGQVNRSVSIREVPVMPAAEIAKMPNDMIPAKRYDPTTKREVVVTDPDGAVQVGKQAYQILRMRRGFAYVRKIQWFTNEFKGVYQLIKRHNPVRPTVSYVQPSEAAIAHAETQPKAAAPEQKKTINEPTVTLVPLHTETVATVDESRTTTVGSTNVAERTKPESTEIPPAFRSILE